MDNDIIEPTQLPATEITGRRSAVSSLGAASIALLAVLGLPAASEALMPAQTRKVQRRRNRSTLSAAKKKRKVGPAGPPQNFRGPVRLSARPPLRTYQGAVGGFVGLQRSCGLAASGGP